MRFPFLAGAGVTLAVMLAGVGTATLIKNLTSDIRENAQEPPEACTLPHCASATGLGAGTLNTARSFVVIQPDPWAWSPYEDPIFMAVQQLLNQPSSPIGVDRISVNVSGSSLLYIDGRLVKQVTFEDGTKQDVPKDPFKSQSGEDDSDQYWSPL